MITLDALTKTYVARSRPVTVLDSIDLRVESNEILAVVGPSGAGKSTLARCINLLERPTSGSITVDGVNLTTLPEASLPVARRSIGTVFQASNMLGRRTAAENVALPMEYMGVVESQQNERVSELLDRVGMLAHAHHYPHQLSGGQRQRVGIARALALRPSVLLADEATSGLDPENTASILALIKEVRADLGLTVIMITHDMQVVRKIADRVARLSHGRLVESGSLLDLLGNPASALGQSLLPAVEIPPHEPGTEIWRVSYPFAPKLQDWLVPVSAEIGIMPDVLFAANETIGDVRVGQAVLGLPADAGARLGTALRRRGAAAARLGTEWGGEGREADVPSAETAQLEQVA